MGSFAGEQIFVSGCAGICFYFILFISGLFCFGDTEGKTRISIPVELLSNLKCNY